MNDSQSSFPSIAQQLRPRFIGAIVFSILAIATFLAASYIEQRQALHLMQTQLPEVTRKLHALNQISELQELAEKQLNSPVAQVADNHRQLLESISRSQLSFGAFEAIKNAPEHELQRLLSNGTRNSELTNNAVVSIEQAQVATRQAIESLPPLKIKTSSGTSNSIRLLLSQIEHSLILLNLQLTALPKPAINLNIEETKLLVNQLVDQQAALAEISLSRELQQLLTEQLTQILSLFLEGDALLGKWQGTTKLYQSYIDNIERLNSRLQKSKQRISAGITKSRAGSKDDVVILWGVKLTWLDIGLILVGLGVIWAIVAIALIFRLFSGYRNELVQLIHAVEHKFMPNAAEQTITSEEQHQLVTTIDEALGDAVTLADVEKFAQENSNEWQQLANIAGISAWKIVDGNLTFTSQEFIGGLILDAGENDERSKLISSFGYWRKILGHETSLTIINAAKMAKTTGEASSVVCQINDKVIHMVVCYSNGSWFGTVADNHHVNALESKISTLESQLNEQSRQALTNSIDDHEALSRMVVQTMLQTQNAAVVSGYNAQPIYRQLERIFDWLRQQQIVAKLAEQGERIYADIDIRQAIYALFNNLINEAQLKHNRIHLALDEKLIDKVKVNERLFSRLVSAFCRLLLKEQYNSELIVKIDVVDQNAGQQVIKITGQIPDKKGQSADYLLKLRDESSVKNRSEQYLFALLSALHAENVNANQVEQGVEVSFTLPLTLASKSTSAIADTRLAQQHVLIISGKKHTRQLLAHFLTYAKAQCETLSKADRFDKDYSLSAISKRKLDAVVVTSDIKHDLAKISQHINSIPKDKRPALVVMQDCHSDLANNGLYTLFDAPICQQQLIETVADCIANKRKDNTQVQAANYKHLHFEPTQVELLLAVKNVEAQQSLWRTLVWLGFKVTIVADSMSMMRRWQTGRYLILMNEFEVSPFVDLLAGKSISRGVFSFSEEEVIELDEQQAEIGKHWHFGRVPAFNQLEDLTKILSPWLKEKATGNTSAPPQSQSSEIEKPSYEHQISASLNAKLNEELPPAFDMEQYAKNQGSPELAVFMLDDYLDNLTDNVQELSELILEKAHEAISQKISEINLIASILSAPALEQLGQQLEQALLNNSYDNMQRLLEQVKYEISVIKHFADAI